ncbi:MAG: hypothetical protein CM15mV103_200 [uncultured marine virus]|nr:MAG: hypothetical protein CM15mV103_200 [uncultured marine virus]
MVLKFFPKGLPNWVSETPPIWEKIKPKKVFGLSQKTKREYDLFEQGIYILIMKGKFSTKKVWGFLKNFEPKKNLGWEESTI